MNDWLKTSLHHLRDFGLELCGGLLFLLIGYIRARLRRSAKQLVEMQETINKENEMEKKIIDGAELDVDFKIEGGKIVLMPVYAGAGGYAKIEMGVDAEYFLKKLAEKIPGVIDDAIISIAIEAIKKV